MTSFPFESLRRDIKENEIGTVSKFSRGCQRTGRRVFEILNTCPWVEHKLRYRVRDRNKKKGRRGKESCSNSFLHWSVWKSLSGKKWERSYKKIESIEFSNGVTSPLTSTRFNKHGIECQLGKVTLCLFAWDTVDVAIKRSTELNANTTMLTCLRWCLAGQTQISFNPQSQSPNNSGRF